MQRTGKEVAEAVSDGKREIVESIVTGYVPASVSSFSELHDYVDANDFAGFTDPARRADWSTDDLIRFQNIVDAWLRSGRPEE